MPEQFTEEERRSITETAEMIFNFKIGDNLQSLIGTLESFLLVRVNAARKEEREKVLTEVKEMFVLFRGR